MILATSQTLLPPSGIGVLAAHRIGLARRVLLALPWLAFLWQLLLAQSSTDVICALLAALGSFLVLFDAFRIQRLLLYPLSTLVVLGFAITLELGPSLFTAIEGNSLTFNLQVPVLTFTHSLLASCLVVVAHAVYRRSPVLTAGRGSLQKLLIQIGIFQPLRTREVILMGGLGTFALGITTWFAGLTDSTPLVKFVEGFRYLSIVPAAFLLQGLWAGSSHRGKQDLMKQLLVFGSFMALIVLVSVGRNSRGTYVVPISCLMLGLALEWLYGLIRIRVVSIVVTLLAVLLVLPLVTDLSTAMVMVRGQRSDISTLALVEQTVDQLQDRVAIHKYREASTTVVGAEWDETYVSNIFLSRFANVKYPDNSLENAQSLSTDGRERIAKFQWLRLLAILPSPFLNLLSVPPNLKDEVTRLSIGDELYFLASGDRYALGGFRQGHFFGSGMAGFGFNYLILLLGGLLLFFTLNDSLALTSAKASPIISVVAITQFIALFTYSNAETVLIILSWALRGYVELIVLFALLRWLLRRVSPA